MDWMLVWIGSPRRSGSHLLFLDRDGVLNEDSPDYIKNWGEFRFYSEVLEALRVFRSMGVSVVISSNQSGLHRGLIRWSDFWFMHEQMVRVVREAGGDLLAAFYCPHRPDEACGCRKPSPSLLLAALRLFQVPPEHTVFVGDRITDVQAAVAAGSRPVLLERSPLGEVEWSKFGIPDPPKRIRSLREVESLFVGSSSVL
jgi:D-glycero-D-manno-heptose 1,7-bisphosphate phosphatase